MKDIGNRADYSPTRAQIENYHVGQFYNPYHSTAAFFDWLDSLVDICKNSNILDMACGAGANMHYAAQRFPSSSFTGIEINAELVDIGGKLLASKNSQNARLLEGDWLALGDGHKNKYDGVINLQTLFMFPDWKEPIAKLIELNPKWIAITSIFYEGPIDCISRIVDQTTHSEHFMNVFSLPPIKSYCEEYGYTNFYAVPYGIDIDLPKSDDGGMGTFTEKLENGSRLQISGPKLMPWYFILASRT